MRIKLGHRAAAVLVAVFGTQSFVKRSAGFFASARITT